MIELLEHRIAPATFIVTNLDDTGPGSLRDAIDQANNRTGADVILFQKGLTGVIELTNGEIEISDELAIKGPGASKLAISGSSVSRIFTVSDGEDNEDSPLFVSALEFRNGNDGSGGAINSEESLNVRDCVFYNNSGAASGGAITASHPDESFSVNIRGTVFVENESTFGGALSFLSDGAVTLMNNKFLNNSSSLSGGAIFGGAGQSKANIKVLACEFMGNRSDVSSGATQFDLGDGGALSIRGSRFIDNHAETGLGGALFAHGGDVKIEKSEFARNSAKISGGALQLDFEGRNLLIQSCRITDNSVLDAPITGTGGGGIRLTGDTGNPDSIVRIQNSAITGNSVSSGNGSGLGGGISISEGDGIVRISGCTIANNVAPGGGGISIGQTNQFDGPDVLISRSQILGNASKNEGGGIAAFGDGTLLLRSTLIFQNSAETEGGGIFLAKGAPSTITGSTVSQNFAGSSGGGISALSQLHLDKTKILGNVTDFKGGGILSTSELTLDRCLISANFAQVGSGLAHTVEIGNPPATILKSKVIGNFGSELQIAEEQVT